MEDMRSEVPEQHCKLCGKEMIQAEAVAKFNFKTKSGNTLEKELILEAWWCEDDDYIVMEGID